MIRDLDRRKVDLAGKGESGGCLMRLPGEKEFKPMHGAHVAVPAKRKRS